MAREPLCSQIGCVYWSSSSIKSYGCQLFSDSDQCYGAGLPGVTSNQYALYASAVPTHFQEIVEAGIRGSDKYRLDLKAQEKGMENEYPLRRLEATPLPPEDSN